MKPETRKYTPKTRTIDPDSPPKLLDSESHTGGRTRCQKTTGARKLTEECSSTRSRRVPGDSTSSILITLITKHETRNTRHEIPPPGGVWGVGPEPYTLHLELHTRRLVRVLIKAAPSPPSCSNVAMYAMYAPHHNWLLVGGGHRWLHGCSKEGGIQGCRLGSCERLIPYCGSEPAP